MTETTNKEATNPFDPGPQHDAWAAGYAGKPKPKKPEGGSGVGITHAYRMGKEARWNVKAARSGKTPKIVHKMAPEELKAPFPIRLRPRQAEAWLSVGGPKTIEALGDLGGEQLGVVVDKALRPRGKTA